MKTPISAVIITHNEADNIARCLQSLQGLVDEIIVLDAFSDDETVALANANGAKVLHKEWIGYSHNKNFANAAAKHDWILSIDADEAVDATLATTLKKLTLNNNTVYSINRLTRLGDAWVYHSDWYPDWKIRLFNKKEVYWQGDFVHETLHIPKQFRIRKIAGLLLHYSYKNDIDHWQRIEKYANLAAQELFKKGKKATLFKLWISPIARFIKTFFIKKGILDGKIGWKISCRNAYLVHQKYRILQQLLKNKTPHE